ncbi:MAG: LacI family transcriptional regulator, partial [Rubrivivax sp.]
HGLSIPGDVSVVGQNDMLLTDMVSPPLTTIRMQHHEMGRQAGHLIIDEIEARSAPDAAPATPRMITLAPELVERDSTAAI